MGELLDELIAILENASEGDGNLSWEIAQALGWGEVWIGQTIYIPPGEIADRARRDRNSVSLDDLPEDATTESPRYTTSVDAALTLVPEGWFYIIRSAKPKPAGAWPASANVYTSADPPDEFGHPKTIGKSAPLAICIAALRARSATGGD